MKKLMWPNQHSQILKYLKYILKKRSPNNQIKFNSINDLSVIWMTVYSFKVFSHTFSLKIEMHRRRISKMVE